MFKKGPDIDKKKLLQKASDVKKDSLTRLKHFKTLIEHLELNELPLLFRSHFSFIYHTFIDTFSTFDCTSKQRREDLDCILFMLEKILVFNPELIKKRWQFYSITFVMQKLLHQNNTWRLRQEGVRLFTLWFLILCDKTNAELQIMFASLVPGLVPPSSLPSPSSSSPSANASAIQTSAHGSTQLPIKLCSIDPLVPISANEQAPDDETSFYLDSLLQFMVTQCTKPHWTPPEEAKKNQELSFSFMFSMFKKIYLQSLFPNFNPNLIQDPIPKSYYNDYNINQYVDEVSDTYQSRGQVSDGHIPANSPPKSKRDLLQIGLKQSSYLTPSSPSNLNNNDHERSISLSAYQSIVIRWLTRIMRQDMILRQDELIKTGGSSERREFQVGDRNSSQEFSSVCEGNSATIFQNMETSSREMEIARKVVGTWPDNIAVLHEIFRRAFLNYFQPASMKRVVNVYKEWICNGGPNQSGSSQPKSARLGYTSFGDLLQVFVLNSSNAFVTRVHNPAMLDEQVEMCKRIMNIYRYMVMKIYMNAATWEQLLNVMLSITQHLFQANPPDRKESTIGGRIAPAFFQTFIVSWIRANLYVHISNQMWAEFHRVMKNLIRWRELIEEWSTTMSSLTRVLVKHVYGLSLTDLPLDKPIDRRRRPKATKSFSTAENSKPLDEHNHPSGQHLGPHNEAALRRPRSGSTRLAGLKDENHRGLSRSNSDGYMHMGKSKLYYSSLNSDVPTKRMRKIQSEYFLFDTGLDASTGRRSNSPCHNDVIDGTSLQDQNAMIDHDHVVEVQQSAKASETSKANTRHDSKTNSDRCVLLGGSLRGWTPENSVIMWRRMFGLFEDINKIEDSENHLIALRCLAVVLCDFLKTRENLGVSPDNQSTPSQPNLVPPYTYQVGWLLEATNLPKQFKDSRLLAYKLLCLMSIRRHDMELPQQYYTAFYECLYRGLTSSDSQIHATIIKNSTQLLSLELPGATLLVQSLFERSRSILLNAPKMTSSDSSPRDQAVLILSNILALHRPIRKLMVLKAEMNNPMNLVASGDIKTKIFETFLACNMRPPVLDDHTRSKSLCSMAIHVYQELCDKYDCFEVEKLLESLLTDLQDSSNSNSFRVNCDLLRLFAEHAVSLSQSRPSLVSSVIQVVCQLIVELSSNESNKEAIYCLLICLEDWCMAVGKNFLLKPVDHVSSDDDDTLSTCFNEYLITIVLRSLENVYSVDRFVDESNNRGARGSVSTSRVSDGHSVTPQPQNADNNFPIQRDRTMTNENHRIQDIEEEPVADYTNLKAVKLACQVAHQKLLTYLGHFPLRQVGAATMACCVNESDYLCVSDQEMNEFKNVSDVCLLVVDDCSIVSFIGGASSKQPVHIIVRNLCGKYSWDATCLDLELNLRNNEQCSESIVIDPETFQQEDSRASMKYDSDYNEDGTSSSSLSSRSSTNRDCIGDLLNQLSNLVTTGPSSASSQNLYKKRNCALSVSNFRYKIAQAEETMLALLTNQRFQELNYCERSDEFDKIVLNIGSKLQPTNKHSSNELVQQSLESLQQQLSFEQCKQLIQQLGYLSWEKRSKVYSLAKSARLLRELKNLDSQPSRETHKIAILYIANGQEDKNSILTNSSGSRAFEDFVSGLGWEVNLASHLGFKGGLQSNKSTGETSPYYCNSTTEVMFHVSTRIPITGPADDESLNRKLRHLGNDEIHIVWSEHSRDYRRGIIPTEFGDVIIAIYPMLTSQGYYRIQVSSKQDVPLFGPLFDNCIVHQTSLASLVRATAINASRAKRLKLPYYQSHFEERNRLIDTIVQNHREKLSFEDFAVQLYQTSVIKGYQPTGGAQNPACCAQQLAQPPKQN